MGISSKLQCSWKGPYSVVENITDVVCLPRTLIWTIDANRSQDAKEYYSRLLVANPRQQAEWKKYQGDKLIVNRKLHRSGFFIYKSEAIDWESRVALAGLYGK